MIINCHKCIFFTISSHYNSIIYKCNKWGLKSNSIIPSKIVKQSILKECPFYSEKTTHQPEINKNNNDIFV